MAMLSELRSGRRPTGRGPAGPPSVLVDRIALAALSTGMVAAVAFFVFLLDRRDEPLRAGALLVALLAINVLILPPCGLALYRLFDDPERPLSEKLGRMVLFVLLGPLAAGLVLRQRIAPAREAEAGR